MENQIMTDKEIVDRLLSDDADYEYEFFTEISKPLLCKIRWSILDNRVDILDVTYEYMLFLKSNDWKKLRDFRFECTLFGYIRYIACNHFLSIRHLLIPDTEPTNKTKKIISVEPGWENEISKIIKSIPVSKYRELLLHKYIDKKTDQEIADLLHISSAMYRKVLKKAEKQLISYIKNEGEPLESVFIKPEKKIVIPLPEPDPTIDIKPIDIRLLIQNLPDKYKLVIEALVFNHRSKADIADELNVSLKYVDVIMSRAMNILKSENNNFQQT